MAGTYCIVPVSRSHSAFLKFAAMNDSAADRSRSFVLLTHGFGSHRWFMALMARRLRAAGFRTGLWGYRSFFSDIESHGERLRSKLEKLNEDPSIDTIHLVAHSMGGILARCALAREKPEKFGRLVMIGTPNHGSYIAGHLEPLARRFCRTLLEVSDREGSFTRCLPPPTDLEFGVIASRRDRVVRLESTFLEGQADHLIIPSQHTEILFRRDTSRQVAHFLEHGCFDHSPAAVSPTNTRQP